MQFSYDELSRLIEISNSFQEKIQYSYDAAGNRTETTILTSTNQIQWNSSQVFDELNRLKTTHGANGQENRFGYDLDGNHTTSIDGRQGTIEQTYDELGRITRYIDADSYDSVFTYNNHDLLTSVTDANGNTTTYSYDAFGNLISQTSPDTGTTTYQYDPAGNRTRAVDSRGVVTEYRYDAVNRLIEVIHPASPEEDITYSYDSTSGGNYGVGRLTSIQSDTHNIEYRYNHLGLITQKQTTQDNSITTIQYQYDAAGQLTGMTYPSGRLVRYQRDTQGRIQAIYTRADALSPEEPVLAATYLPFGPVNHYAYGNGLTHDLDYDQSYRLTSVTVGGINPLLDRGYQYDLTDNITGIANNLDTHKSQAFDYDALNRLIRAEGIYGEIDYTYDPVGNRLTQDTSQGGTQHQDVYIHDANNNQLRYVDRYTNGIPSQTREFTYDAAGNRAEGTDEAGRELDYEYNHANRLQRITLAGQTLAEYRYNPLGQRIQKVLANNQVEHYHYNESGQLIAVTDGAGVSRREYIYRDHEQVALISRPAGHVSNPPHSSPIVLDDNSVSLVGSHNIATSHSGYTGNGFIDYIGEGQADWIVEVPATGGYTLQVYYALWAPVRRLVLLVDDEEQHHFSFPSTAGWNDWQRISTSINLAAGQRKISLKTLGDSGPNIDRIELVPLSTGIQQWLLDEATASFQGNHIVTDVHAGYAGTGFIDYIGEGQVDWDIDVPVAGGYALHARYALGASSRRLAILVNEEVQSILYFPPTANWADWRQISTNINLPAGQHRVSLKTLGESGPNLDQVALVSDGSASHTLTLDTSTATFQGNHALNTSHAGYTGEGFIDYIGEGQVDWPISIGQAGHYRLNIRYALSGTNRPLTLLINEQPQGQVNFVPTAAWNIWNETAVTLELSAGQHILSLKTTGNSGPNIDRIALIAVSAPAENEPDTPPGGPGSQPPSPAPESEPELYFIHNDHLGTPQVVTNQSQQVVWMVDYLPFGQVIADPNNTLELYSRFPGQYLDSETGLYYNYFRDYDPTIGRYIQSDPIGLEGGINTYAYALNNPYRYIDFFGLDVCIHRSEVGFRHQWISFNSDPARSYGAWPFMDYWGGWQHIENPDSRSQDIGKSYTQTQCIATPNHVDALLESWIHENYDLADPTNNPRYYYGFQDCRSFVKSVINQLRIIERDLKNAEERARIREMIFRLLFMLGRGE